MKPVRIHCPGLPSDPQPPVRLIQLADSIQDPLIQQAGITTADGRKAVYVTVSANTPVPIASVQGQAGGFPVVDEADPDEPPRAGPAFPAAARGRTAGKRRQGNR